VSATTTTEGERAPLRDRAAKGVRWGALDQGAQFGIRFVTTIVLARLLTPKDIGLMALALVVLSFGRILIGLGLSEALVQRRQLEQEHVHVAFTLTLVSGIAAAGATVAASGALADLFGEPRLRLVLIALSPVFVLSGVERTPNDMLVRTMRFREFYISSTIAAVVGAIVAIGVAVPHPSVWALVVMTLTEALVATTLAWVFATRAGIWRPVFGWSLARTRALIGFGLYVTGSRLVTYANVDTLVIGKSLGATDLGYYSLAFRVVIMPIQKVSVAIGATAFSVFSLLQEDLPKVQQAVARANRYVALICFPLTIGVSASAPFLVPVLFGSKWNAAIPVVAILAFLGPRLSLTSLDRAIFQALGKPQWSLRLSIFGLAVFVPALLIGVHYGLEGAAISVVAISYATLPPSLWLRARLMKTSVVSQLAPLAPVAIATAIMAAAAFAARESLQGHVSDAVGLLAVVAVGALAFLAGIRISAPPLLREALRDLRPTTG
jgi:O-antigen/teichoic acid export membrane protein